MLPFPLVPATWMMFRAATSAGWFSSQLKWGLDRRGRRTECPNSSIQPAIPTIPGFPLNTSPPTLDSGFSPASRAASFANAPLGLRTRRRVSSRAIASWGYVRLCCIMWIDRLYTHLIVSPHNSAPDSSPPPSRNGGAQKPAHREPLISPAELRSRTKLLKP